VDLHERSSWRTWTTQTTSAISSKMHKRILVVWQKKPRRLDSKSIGKTEVMRVNSKQQDPVQLHQENIKEVEKFVYLGSVVIKDRGMDQHIKSRINKARHTFNTL
jgi:hypothetical protein